MFLWCSDDEDDTAELLAELQRIKKERAQEEAKKVRFKLCERYSYLYFTLEQKSLVSKGHSSD